ncbi:hypothetical protein ACFO5K_04295 [Nocardia halotolerans]|uniref:Uncharacterized protein n=1 Tax=Nocardia halotolerans TaxID=1755878 RepID=A0ABV8VBM4_9NOCA
MNPDTTAVAGVLGVSPLDIHGTTADSTTFTTECDDCTATGLVRLEAEYTHRAGNWTETTTHCIPHAAEAIWALDMADAASITAIIPTTMLQPTALAA